MVIVLKVKYFVNIVLDKLFLVWIGEKGDEKSILYNW